jgi:hypothetical protein
MVCHSQLSQLSKAIDMTESQLTASEDADALDIVWGAINIGRLIKRTPRQVYYLAERKLIPVEKVGDSLVARKS